MRQTKAEIEAQRELDAAANAAIAFQKTPEYKAQQAQELAEIVRKWRGVTPEKPRGEFPVSRAAQILGIPKRTLEGVEQGRGFIYPILLTHAIRSFE